MSETPDALAPRVRVFLPIHILPTSPDLIPFQWLNGSSSLVPTATRRRGRRSLRASHQTNRTSRHENLRGGRGCHFQDVRLITPRSHTSVIATSTRLIEPTHLLFYSGARSSSASMPIRRNGRKEVPEMSSFCHTRKPRRSGLSCDGTRP